MMKARKRRPAGKVAGPAEASVLKFSAGGVRAPLKSSAAPDVDAAGSVETLARRISRAVSIPTVSYADYSRIDLKQHRNFHVFLRRAFPLVHKNLEFRKINDYALLYFWKGSEQSLKPYLLAAHFDVVPAEDSSHNEWAHSPFAGHIDGGFVWGRGTLDIKMSLVAIMHAAESLLAEGYRPARGVYFAFGGDEEIDGKKGARSIASFLAEQGVELEYVLDEGTVIASGMYPGIEEPMALVSIAEKGHCNVSLNVSAGGGHSSLPHKENAVGILCKAVTRLDSRPFPARLTDPVRLFLKGISRHSSFPERVVLSRPGLFWPILKIILSRNSNTNAMIRTSAAVTMISGSDKENVLPAAAQANINVRILPGESIRSVLDRIEKVIDDSRVAVRPNPDWLPNEPVDCSDPLSYGYSAISQAIKRIVPEALILPFLLSGSTDSKHYTTLTPYIYRFSPVILNQDELKGIHGVNERISMDNIRRCADFYITIISITSEKAL